PSDARLLSNDSADTMSIRSVSNDRSTGAGGAASTASESYSSARATRKVRVSDVDVPGPFRVLLSVTTALTDRIAPSVRPSWGSARVARNSVVLAPPMRAAPNVHVVDLNISPEPVVTVYSRCPPASPISSVACATNEIAPAGTCLHTVSRVG